MTEPTPIDLASPEFNAIWDVVKKWDLERTPGDGYHGGTGTDVMEILNSLRRLPMTNSKQWEKRVEKDLRKVYEASASTDDRSDVDCLISHAIYLIKQVQEEAYQDGYNEAIEVAKPRKGIWS